MNPLQKKIYDTVFYGILDTAWTNDYYEKCRQLIAGGSGIIQLRAKKETSAERRAIAEKILPLFDSEDAPIFIINDDADLAKNLPNVGLHIGQDDGCPRKMRDFLGEGRVLGLSTHSIGEAEEANFLTGIIDYFAIGPIYATLTKPGRKAVGLELVSHVAKMHKNMPFFAIGGINIETVEDVARAGAERIVAVSDILKAEDSAAAIRNLLEKFDSAKCY